MQTIAKEKHLAIEAELGRTASVNPKRGVIAEGDIPTRGSSI